MLHRLKFFVVLICTLFVMVGHAAHAASEFTITTTASTTSFSFKISAAGTFEIDWGDGSAIETITKTDTNDTTYSHTYSTAGAYTIGISGQATAYNTSSSTAAISFKSNTNIAGISGSLGAIFGTLSSGDQTQPRFYQTFYSCRNMTGEIPTELFDGISGAPVSNMFGYTFYGCSSLTGYVDGGTFTVPAGSASSPYTNTFNGAGKMDTVCPTGTYAVDKPDSAWPVAVCSPCPETHPLSDIYATSINQCYTVSQTTCDAGQYYDATTSQCVTCPENSYCTGGTKTYYDGTSDGGIAACPAGTTSPAGSTTYGDCTLVAPEFTITTTADTTSFSFRLSAAGTFLIDWGDGSGIQTITKTDTNDTTYSHTYSTAGTYNIGISGQATAYNTSYDIAAISFFRNTNIAGISGSLGAIFGTLSSGTPTQPRFYETFYGCSNMTGEIPAELFDGISGQPTTYMFFDTFWNCSKLSGSIPENLFAGIQGKPASDMFYGTFYGCSNLSGSIPENLFAGIQGAPAGSMFAHTFHGCSNLTSSIPENLFAGIQGAPAGSMFAYTFYGCSNLTSSIPENLFAGIQGKPASSMFSGTFAHCSSLSGSIPEKLFAGIQGAPADSMFYATFSSCSGLSDSIPENLFAGIQGKPASSMFYWTFRNCSGLSGSIPENLFAGIEGAPASSMFNRTFENCSKLSGSIPKNLFAGIEGTPASNMFYRTFYGCSGLSGSIPKNLFAGIEGKPAYYMFYETFYNCSNLTGYVDGGTFTIPAGSATHPYNNTFYGASKMDTVCPENTYAVDKPDSAWTVAVCSPCPDGTTSPAGSTSADACVAPAQCDTGFAFNHTGVCSALCAAGFTQIRTSTGVAVTLFATKNTTPAINIGHNDAICYADLVPGTATNAINIDYNGTIYHTVAAPQ